jgi:hypothetical protein
MTVRFARYFLTFVLTPAAMAGPVALMTASLAAVLVVVSTPVPAFAKPEKLKPPATAPAKPESEKPSPPPPERDDLDENNLISAPTPPPPPDATRTYVYPYRQNLAVRFGGVFSTEKIDPPDDNRFTYLMGVTYLWPRYSSPQAELGADIAVKLGGHLHFAVKHIWFERNHFRPFWLWGLTHEAVPDDRLGTFLNHENYYGRVAIGMEDVITLPKSVRLELDLLAGVEKQMLELIFGYSWGW